MSAPVQTRELSCDMLETCAAPVTHVGARGFVYCTAHAAARSGAESTRRLRPWEAALLRRGLPLLSYAPISKAEDAARRATAEQQRATITPGATR